MLAAPSRSLKALCASLCGLLLALPPQLSVAGPLHDHLIERRNAQDRGEAAEEPGNALLPDDVRVVRDVPYGQDEQQRFDVYGPPHAKGAPVIFMVHGGAWSIGDKGARAVVQNKVARWVPKGFIVISTNYRLIPKADPLEQAKDVARAIAAAQEQASVWGGDRNKFILMGHSAGAHLVSLLATKPSVSAGIVPSPWLGTVSLDSAALDIVELMHRGHARLYDRAFGDDPEYWRSASPFDAISGTARPMLMVCSTLRSDSCLQASRFAAKAESFGSRASVSKQDLSHLDVNQRLGEQSAYTDAVESFMSSLDGVVAKALNRTMEPGTGSYVRNR